jgi:hypothetical protein
MRTFLSNYKKWRRTTFLFLVFLTSGVLAQNVPELMYFKFDAAGNQQNYASAPVGNNPAVLTGLTTGSTGQFGTALVGNGLTSTSNNLNTGWGTSLPSTGWTISFWLNNFPATSSTTFYYFGDVSAGTFRCFTGGVAGNGNLMLRGTGLTDVPINGIPNTPTVIHLVYTGSAVIVYFDGVFHSQTTESSVSISGAGPFTIGGYSSSNSINSGTLMDEFRLYNRALTATEIANTWNHSLPLSGPPAVVTASATSVTSTTATLNGTVNANGATTTTSFEYGLTTAYGTTLAGSPPTVTGNTATPVTVGITGLLPGTTYHFRINGTNSNATANGLDMSFTTPAILPALTTVAATGVNSTDATLNGTVNAGGATTTVSFEYGLTTAYGSSIAAVPPTVSGNTTTNVSANITGLVVNTTYHFRVKGVNSVGGSNGLDMTFITTTCPAPSAAGPITGPVNGCQNSTGNIYSVTPIANATGYNWSLPAGSSITAGWNTNSITVTFGATSGTVSVNGTNSCGTGSSSSVNVTLSPAPVPTITGQTGMCINSGFYTYSTQAGMNNYVWTVTSGGSINSGSGTNSILVTWTGAGAQSVSVNYTNAGGCPAGSPTVMPVTVNGPPAAAGTVTGPSSVCAGSSGKVYSVATIPGATTYVWTIPAGASIVSGSGTQTITLTFSPTSTSGNISVFGNNLCGSGATSPQFAVSVDPLAGAAGPVTGPASVCQGETGVSYSIDAVANATSYNWIMPPGANIVSGGTSNIITVDFTTWALAGNVTVYGLNGCGSGTASPGYPITPFPVPAIPFIYMTGSTLMSNAANGNQWYLDGNMIPGANGQSHEPQVTGTYTDMVTVNGCTSPASQGIYVVVTGTGPQVRDEAVSVYPNPCNGKFAVRLPASAKEHYDITVLNTIGIEVFGLKNEPVTGTHLKTFDLVNLPDGVYSIIVRNDDFNFTGKVIISR